MTDPSKKCAFLGCNKVTSARGYCQSHYTQMWRGKPLTPIHPGSRPHPPQKNIGACTVEACEKPQVTGQMCYRHYRFFLKYGVPDGPPTVEAPEVLCSFEGCTQIHRAKGLCSTHYSQQHAGKELYLIEKTRQPAIVGSRRDSSQGYTIIYLPGHSASFKSGWAMEHRVVMSETLGRSLLSTETVHHKNGDRTDNRPENLELWSTRQPKGQRVADKVEWAWQIIEQYSVEISKHPAELGVDGTPPWQ